MRFLPENNLGIPVLIELDDGSSGSGFYLSLSGKKMFLVTASHVLFKEKLQSKSKDKEKSSELKSKKVKLTSYDQDPKNLDPIKIELNLDLLKIKNSDKDVAVVGLATIGGGKAESVDFYEGVTPSSDMSKKTMVTVAHATLKKYDDVLVSNEVFCLGYPNSLSTPEMQQIDYTRPLLRKGIIAGKNPKNRTIILDCPIYFGNSGGLAIEVEEVGIGRRKFSIIGVVVQYVPFVEKLISTSHGYVNTNVENSGYSVVVPSDTILELVGQFEVLSRPFHPGLVS